MTIKAILWTYEKRTDGTADVKIYAYPPKKYRSTGIKVKPADWDKKRGRVKSSNPAAIILNAKIERLITEFTTTLHQGRGVERSLIKFLDLFIEEAEKQMHDIGESTIKKYRSTRKRLKQYLLTHDLEDIKFTDCTIDWHASFCRFLADHAGCNSPGLTNHTKNLKKILGVAMRRKYHENRDFQDFKVNRSSKHKIYLREEEIHQMCKVNLSGFDHLARERDRFVVSYYFLMRYGDSVKINRTNAYQEQEQWYYRYVSEKTKIPVILPIKPIVFEILEHNKWYLGEDTNQEANRHIKQVAAMAGINEMAKEGDTIGPKWRFVTTHTARRSAATNMALSGVQIDTIAKLGGWDKIATLKSYLRASGIDVARVAADLSFFK